MEDERADYWLNGMSEDIDPSTGEKKVKLKNAGGEFYWKELRDLADSQGPVEIVRALAYTGPWAGAPTGAA